MNWNMKKAVVKSIYEGLVLVAVLAVTVLPASAQSTYTWDITPGTVGSGDSAITGGAGTWNSINGNWTTDGGVNNIAWDNTSPSVNTAVFNAAGINGTSTVTLGETINIKTLSLTNLRNSGPTQKYTITGSTLNFSAGGSITTASADGVNYADYAFITSAINGAPNVVHGFSGANNQLVFAPSSGSVALGTLSGSGITRLAGSTTGNSLVGTSSTSAKIKVSSGTWTLTGTAYAYEHWIEGGNFIISTGTLQHQNRAINLIGGTLHMNNPAAIRANSTPTGGDSNLRLRGGSIDNTRGAAITTSTWNPGMNCEANWTFIGSQGANSDLYLGNGGVSLNGATRQVTVQNAATTLAFGGVFSNGGLTKAGVGTLELRGASSYTGATTVNAGTLLVKSPGSLNAGSAVAVNGGTLAGNGTINGPVTVGVAGSIAPGTSGAPTGTLTINNNCTITNNLNITVDGALSSKLVVTNTLTISGGTLNVNVVNPSSVPVIIATYGTLIGQFAVKNGLGALQVDYNYLGGNAIALILPSSGTVYKFR